MSFFSCCRPLIASAPAKFIVIIPSFGFFTVYDSLVRLTHHKLKSAINGKVKNRRQISCLNICRRGFLYCPRGFIWWSQHSISGTAFQVKTPVNVHFSQYNWLYESERFSMLCHLQKCEMGWSHTIYDVIFCDNIIKNSPKLASGEKSPLKTKCLEIKTFKKILREMLSRCTLQNVE